MSYFKGPSRPIGPRYKPKPKKLGKSLPGRVIYTMPPKESNDLQTTR